MTGENCIVITGLGAISPIGEGKERFWRGLEAGNSGIKPISLFDTSQFDYHQAAEITDFDPKRYLGKKGLKYLNRTTKLLMSATFLCLKDAGIKNDSRDYLCYGPEQLGIALGTTCGILHSISSFDRELLTEGPQFVSPMAFTNTVINAPAGHLSIKEDIRGLNVTVSTGYNASVDATGISLNYLRSKRVNCMIAGGSEELCEELFLSYTGQGLISEVNFLGEGSMMFALESMDNAIKRRADIYGEIVGYGNTLSPNTEGLVRAIELALEEANLEAGKIDWIILGTNLNQQQKDIERNAIEEIFTSNISKTDLRPLLGDSYSAGGSMQIGASLRLINQNLANTILITSVDPAGNNSALIIRSV
jgi:3-oxoacyl-[acyl-carrier-protein] synthase II